jgi:hypothetical protein
MTEKMFIVLYCADLLLHFGHHINFFVKFNRHAHTTANQLNGLETQSEGPTLLMPRP